MENVVETELRALINKYELSRNKIRTLIDRIKPARAYTGRQGDARAFLRKELLNGPVALQRLYKLGEKEGLDGQTIRRAFISLNGKSKLIGYAKNRKALWSLPTPEQELKLEAELRKLIPGDRARLIRRLEKKGYDKTDILKMGEQIGLKLKDGWYWELPMFSKGKNGGVMINQPRPKVKRPRKK